MSVGDCATSLIPFFKSVRVVLISMYYVYNCCISLGYLFLEHFQSLYQMNTFQFWVRF